MRTAATGARRRWVRWLVGGFAGLLGLAGAVLIGATYQPGWYRPASVTPDDFRTIRNELPSFGSAIGTYLERGQPFRIELTDEQINRWLAARGEIWPSLRRALPAEIQDPAIAFLPGEVVVGARYERKGMSSVVSLAATLDVEDSGSAIVIRLGGIYAGLVPVPQMLVEPVAKKALAKALRSNWPRLSKYTQVGDVNLAEQLRIGPDQLAGYIRKRDFTQTRLPSHWVWPNGKFPFYVSNLQIEQGKLLIDIVPTPRQMALSEVLGRPGK